MFFRHFSILYFNLARNNGSPKKRYMMFLCTLYFQEIKSLSFSYKDYLVNFISIISY